MDTSLLHSCHCQSLRRWGCRRVLSMLTYIKQCYGLAPPVLASLKVGRLVLPENRGAVFLCAPLPELPWHTARAQFPPPPREGRPRQGSIEVRSGHVTMSTHSPLSVSLRPWRAHCMEWQVGATPVDCPSIEFMYNAASLSPQKREPCSSLLLPTALDPSHPSPFRCSRRWTPVPFSSSLCRGMCEVSALYQSDPLVIGYTTRCYNNTVKTLSVSGELPLKRA